MSNTPWKKPFAVTQIAVHYVYLSTMLLNGALFFFLPGSKGLPKEEYHAIFVSFLVAAFLTIPLALYLYRRILSPERLESVCRASGFNAAATAFKTGTILIACVGDLSGVAGASFFAYSRDANGLVYFLAGWTVQYGLGIAWLARGKRLLTRLAAPEAAPGRRPPLVG